MVTPLRIARNDRTDVFILPGMANRHGLITGATGTGKTVTLQTLAEQFSAIGVPCVMSDVKGDLTGISQPGGNNAKVAERLEKLGIDPKAEKLLRASTDYVAGLQRFSIDTRSTLEVVLKSGQKIQFDNATRVSVQRPNKLRAERITADLQV